MEADLKEKDAASQALGVKEAAPVLIAVGAVIALLFVFYMKHDEEKRRDVALTSPPPTRGVPLPVQFRDVTKAAGISFVHNNGAFGAYFFPEQQGAGAAFIDYDGDGRQDIFFVNARNWTQAELDAYRNGNGREDKRKHGFVLPRNLPPRRTTGALYRNNGNGTFSDVTKNSGLDIEMYGFGACAGDYDNDGKPDLYLTSYPRNYLFRNMSTHGRARFTETTAAAGVGGSGLSSSAAWVDYNRDGKLDLFVGRYVQWTPAKDIYAGSTNRTRASKVESSPGPYAGRTSLLFRNEGGGRFKDVSVASGIARNKKGALPGKNLGVATCDFDNDGWPDIMVANDTQPNFLFRNNRNGGFSEVAARVGVALSESGKARSGMGVDAADIDGSGRDSFVIGNFAGESLGLYSGQDEVYRDIASRAGVSRASEMFLTFGCLFVDVDMDGWPDIFAANGHIHEYAPEEFTYMPTRQQPLLLHNLAENPARFEDISARSGGALQQKEIARGLACADIDLDGDLDLLMTVKAGAPLLMRNDGGNLNNSLRLTLRGTRSNRSAIGAVVEARVGSHLLRRLVKSGSSYLSQSELPITLGLKTARAVSSVVVKWPSGHISRFARMEAGQSVLIDEDKGILWHKPLRRAAR